MDGVESQQGVGKTERQHWGGDGDTQGLAGDQGDRGGDPPGIVPVIGREQS